MAIIPTYRPRQSAVATPRKRDTRPSAAKRGYGDQWRELRKRVPKTPCKGAGCGKAWSSSHHLDHIVAKSEGGSDDPINLQWLCQACHNRKTPKRTAFRSNRNG